MKNRKAMTLGEILLTMTIMSFIALIAIMTVKPFEKTLRTLYAKAFEFTRDITYTVFLDREEDGFYETPNELCHAFAEYMNTSTHHCDDGDDTCVNDHCDQILDERRATNATTDFREITPDIIASNAMRFYITQRYEHNASGYTDYLGITPKPNYFIVYIDLTGERPPNTPVWTDRHLADIVAFIVTDTADVVPIGAPEFDKRYMTTRVEYPATAEQRDGSTSPPVTYWEAKQLSTSEIDSTDMQTLNFYLDFPPDSPLLRYPAPTFYPALNTAKGCTRATSPCIIQFESFY